MELYYIQTNVLCIIFLATVGVLIRNERGALPALRVTFSRIIIVTAVLCFSDIFAWICDGRDFEGASFLIELFNIIYDGAITVACFIWLNYVKLRTMGLEEYSREKKFLSSIPLVVMLIIVVTNPLMGFLFTIEEGNRYVRGNGIILHWIISWGYLVWATVIVASRIHRAESRLDKKQLVPLLWFIVPPAIAAVTQMLFFGVTAMQCGITVSIVIIAYATMREKVSKDSLTGLNNRNALDLYLDELLSRHSANITVIMCDVDKFKTINDTLGHIVGDIILKRMADILKSACGETKAPFFLCRYGGDEFLLCGADLAESDVQQLKDSVKGKLEGLSHEYGTGIRLGMSMGSAAGNCFVYKDMERLVREADKNMYEEKQKAHSS